MEALGGRVLESETQVLTSLAASATVVLGGQIQGYLQSRFSGPEVLLALGCMHAVIGSIQGVRGFNASWQTLRRLLQSIALQTLAAYVLQSTSPVTLVLHAFLVIQILECVPALAGWAADDLAAFRTNVTYIFADSLSGLFKEAGVPLFAAVLGLCLRGGFLGAALANASVSTLNSWVLDAISGGELSLVWPLVVITFAVEITGRFKGSQALVDFGLYKASSSAYEGLKARGLLPEEVALGLLLFVYLKPRDKVWLGLCFLVLTQAASDWFLNQVSFISTTDPVLSALVIVTAVHFATLVLDFYHPQG
jgi:hypothetical protein